jgi:GTPase SAR1 family protein
MAGIMQCIGGLLWGKCMDRGEITEQLWGLPVDALVAISVRAGLRVLPWLALSKNRQVLGAWNLVDRAKHLLAVFLAYDVGLMTVWAEQAFDLENVARGRCRATNYAADSIAEDDAYDSVRVVSYSIAAAIDDISQFLGGAPSYTFAAIGEASVRDATSSISVALAFVARYVGSEVVNFDFQYKHDIYCSKKYGASKLIEEPLWHHSTPKAWHKQLSKFQAAVTVLDIDFDFWLGWYDDLCQGKPIDFDLQKQRVFLPESILDQTPQQINAYITSISQGLLAGPLNRVRTIFIGDGEAGKTSLIRVLYGEPVVEGIEPKTPGIAIREWPVPATPIKASFWDFGGQVMVHATHQLFLRESCLYVLLVSAREKEKATERAEYWLEHVKSFGKGAPVLIVANKADKEPVRLDESLLLDKYPGMIKGFFQLACTEAKGAFRNQFQQFHQAFCQQLQKVGLHQVQFQKAHFEVLQNLRQRTPQQAFLTHLDYAALCAEHRVDAHSALDSAWLLDILDKLGVIVHFPDMEEVDEYILNPRWLTYGVYTLMYSAQARMTRKQAIALLAANPVEDHEGNKLSYPASKCRIIFEAMRRYKLCYFLPRDPDQLIIPALLPSDIKQHGFDSANALAFHYQFESFLPRHLISELIVDCHEDIANIADQDIVWQHGVLLHNATHNTKALIQADYHFRRLSIWLTKQPAAAEFLAMLRDKVEKIVKRIDIKYTQNIRLPREAQLGEGRLLAEPEWANFKLILAQRNRGITEYVSETETAYSIAKILGLFAPQTAVGTVINLNLNNSKMDGDITIANEVSGSFNKPQT